MAKKYGYTEMNVGQDRQKGIWGEKFKECLEKEREELLEQIKKLQSRGNGYDSFEECYTYMAAKLLRIIEKFFKEE